MTYSVIIADGNQRSILINDLEDGCRHWLTDWWC